MRTRYIGFGCLVLAAAVIILVALPIREWRTGRTPVAPLSFIPPDSIPAPHRRIWIDTDAACGHTAKTDVDDCLALWLLATSPDLEIIGVSTVFGNAPIQITDRTTRVLVHKLAQARHRLLAIHRGAGDADTSDSAASTVAVRALIEALEREPLTIVALGPLTNVAAALRKRRDLQFRMKRVIAVMGRRAGHLFHPAEGAKGAGFLGHGPVFRDFNFAVDPQAVRTVLALHIPLILIPYDAARAVEITPADLHAFAVRDSAAAWIAERSKGWVEYWRTEMGRAGFYPFDAVAAAHIIAPRAFHCADVRARVARDAVLFARFIWPEGLLVDQQPGVKDGAPVLYCPGVQPGFGRMLKTWFGSTQ